MIISPYKFMIGIAFVVLGVGLICCGLISGGPFPLTYVALTLAILLAGVLLGGDAIQSPDAPARSKRRGELSDKTKQEFDAAIRESLSKKAQP